jgi:hypothetical protein
MNIQQRFGGVLADEWAAEGDEPELLPVQLARAGVTSLGVDGMGLSVHDAAGHSTPLGASDATAATAERLQFTAGSGPCMFVLMPRVDERRAALEEAFRRRASQSVIKEVTGQGDVLELGPMRWALNAFGVRLDGKDARRLGVLCQFRNRLAHGRPADDALMAIAAFHLEVDYPSGRPQQDVASRLLKATGWGASAAQRVVRRRGPGRGMRHSCFHRGLQFALVRRSGGAARG